MGGRAVLQGEERPRGEAKTHKEFHEYDDPAVKKNTLCRVSPAVEKLISK